MVSKKSVLILTAPAIALLASTLHTALASEGVSSASPTSAPTSPTPTPNSNPTSDSLKKGVGLPEKQGLRKDDSWIKNPQSTTAAQAAEKTRQDRLAEMRAVTGKNTAPNSEKLASTQAAEKARQDRLAEMNAAISGKNTAPNSEKLASTQAAEKAKQDRLAEMRNSINIKQEAASDTKSSEMNEAAAKRLQQSREDFEARKKKREEERRQQANKGKVVPSPALSPQAASSPATGDVQKPPALPPRKEPTEGDVLRAADLIKQLYESKGKSPSHEEMSTYLQSHMKIKPDQAEKILDKLAM